MNVKPVLPTLTAIQVAPAIALLNDYETLNYSLLGDDLSNYRVTKTPTGLIWTIGNTTIFEQNGANAPIFFTFKLTFDSVRLCTAFSNPIPFVIPAPVLPFYAFDVVEAVLDYNADGFPLTFNNMFIGAVGSTGEQQEISGNIFNPATPQNIKFASLCVPNTNQLSNFADLYLKTSADTILIPEQPIESYVYITYKILPNLN